MTTEVVPKQVLKSLMPDEKVLACATESRLKNPIAPFSIVATNKRLIVLEPLMGGLKHKLTDWQYSDIQNILHKSGLVLSQVGFDTRFGQDFLFDNLEKSDARKVAEAAREMIMSARAPQAISMPEQAHPPSQTPNEDPVKVAKLRFARGEITKEELEEILNILQN